MREPQATSTLGTVRSIAPRAPLSLPRRRLVSVTSAVASAVCAIGLCVATASLSAQIRRGPMTSVNYGWWISGGVSAITINDITDGASQSRWSFGSDPLWQPRVTVEKSLDEFTTLGVVVGYAPVDVKLASITAAANPALPAACQPSCAATTELWTGMLQFRSGGGEGFHTLFEGSAGATAFRNFKTKPAAGDTTTQAVAITTIPRALDYSGTLGAGFGYALSRGMVIAVVQDVGIGFHSKTGLPDGTGRTWRMRNTRASIRLKF
jgi:hypothetical protein